MNTQATATRLALTLILFGLTTLATPAYAQCPGYTCVMQEQGTFPNVWWTAQCVTAPGGDSPSFESCEVVTEPGGQSQHCDLRRRCEAPIDPGSPIMIRLRGKGPWTVSDAVSGVWFDLDGDGDRELVPWPEGDVAFLANDRDGNGQIDDVRELYGSYVPPGAPLGTVANGFDPWLQRDDSDGDGYITPDDPVWTRLFLWHDVNRDGVLDDGERHSLDSVGIQMLDTRPIETGRHDPSGNLFRYMSHLWRDGRRETFYDVYLPE